MAKKLTDYEKELISVILDFERARLVQVEGIHDVLGIAVNDSGELIDFDRLAKALRVDGLGDLAIDVIYGYTNGCLTFDEVFEVIEYAMNNDNESIVDWLMRHE